MNIKTRLRKLENTFDPSTLCTCYPQKRFELYKADLSEDSETSEPVLDGESVPDICPECGKSADKMKIVVQICDQTTKDRFPEEWKAK